MLVKGIGCDCVLDNKFNLIYLSFLCEMFLIWNLFVYFFYKVGVYVVF